MYASVCVFVCYIRMCELVCVECCRNPFSSCVLHLFHSIQSYITCVSYTYVCIKHITFCCLLILPHPLPLPLVTALTPTSLWRLVTVLWPMTCCPTSTTASTGCVGRCAGQHWRHSHKASVKQRAMWWAGCAEGHHITFLFSSICTYVMDRRGCTVERGVVSLV